MNCKSFPFDECTCAECSLLKQSKLEGWLLRPPQTPSPLSTLLPSSLHTANVMSSITSLIPSSTSTLNSYISSVSQQRIVSAKSTLSISNSSPTSLLPGFSLPMVNEIGSLLVKKEPYECVRKQCPSNTTGRGYVYYNSLFPKVNYGLVIIMHGHLQGSSTDNAYATIFDYLCTCLAANGFVAASAQHLKDHIYAQEELLNSIRILKSWPWVEKFDLAGKPIALIGQSEGGGAAFRVARRVKNLEIKEHATSIRTVIGLAPGQNQMQDYDIGDFTGSILIMQGAIDHDSTVGGASLTWYTHTPDVKERYFCWLHGGTHTGFFQEPYPENTVPLKLNDGKLRISQDTQKLVTKNYVVKFLRWKMAGESTHRPLFIGDAHIAFSAPNQPLVQADLDSGRMQIYPRYDAIYNWLPLSSLPEGVVFQDFLDFDFSPITQNHPATYHKFIDFHYTFRRETSRGFFVRWHRFPATKKPLIKIPCDASVMDMEYVPSHIEFQAILVGTQNYPGPATVIARLYDKGGLPSQNTVSFQIAPSQTLETPDNNNAIPTITISALSTVRIKLSDLTLSTQFIKNTRFIYLDFSQTEHEIGAVALGSFRAVFL